MEKIKERMDRLYEASRKKEKSYNEFKNKNNILQKLQKEFIIVAPEACVSGEKYWVLNKETGRSFEATVPIAPMGDLYLIAVKKEFKHTKEDLKFKMSERGHYSISRLNRRQTDIIDIWDFDGKAKYNANLITNAPKLLSSLLAIHDLLLNKYLSGGKDSMDINSWAMFLETSKAIIDFKKGEND